jgi:hypothetical protein
VKFDLLVVGYMGHSALYNRIIGSTTDRLVELAPCAVQVVWRFVPLMCRVSDAGRLATLATGSMAGRPAFESRQRHRAVEVRSGTKQGSSLRYSGPDVLGTKPSLADPFRP